MASKDSPDLAASQVAAADAADELRDELRASKLEVVRLRAVAARLANELERLERDLVNVNAHAARDRQQLRALRQSTSWRVTLPLRVGQRRGKDGASASRSR